MVESSTRVIKKYGNRRLYDTQTSAYINLEDLSTLLKQGVDIKVVDAKTQQDITGTVLLQLILERERQNVEGLPVELLKELIIIGDTPARRWFDVSMKVSLEMLRRLKKTGLAGAAGWHVPWLGIDVQELMQSVVGGGGAKRGAAASPRVEPDPEEFVEEAPPAETVQPGDGDEDAPTDSKAGKKAGRSSRALDLSSQLEELKARLANLEATFSQKGRRHE